MRALGVTLLLLVAGFGAGVVLSTVSDRPGGADSDAAEPATPVSAASPSTPRRARLDSGG